MRGKFSAERRVELLCPVRECRKPLERADRMLRCEAGHAFNVSRSGACTLFQPQDRKSVQPGDSIAAVEARHRWLERGRANGLLRELEAMIAQIDLPADATVVDLGCGEGYLTARLAHGRSWKVCGVDLSERALTLAAQRMPEATWLRANADRRLPFPDRSVDLVLSLFGRRPAAEVQRVLKPTGAFLVAVPAQDDLIELRAAALGEGLAIERADKLMHELAPGFELAIHREFRERARLEQSEIADALAMTYRGRRNSQAQKTKTIDALEVTLSADLLLFRPRGADRNAATGPADS